MSAKFFLMFHRFNQNTVASPYAIGLLFALGAALGFSAKAIFVKLAYTYQVDAITLLMFRMAFALPVFIIIAVIEEGKAKTPLGYKNIMALIVLGLIGYYFSSLLDFLGLQYISAGLERLILFVYPTMVVILSAVFLKKRLPKRAYIALLLSYVGIALVMLHDVKFSGGHVILGSILVFGSTLTYSTFLVGSGELIPKIGAKRFTAYAMIVSCVVVIIQFAVMRGGSYLYQPLPVYGYGFAMALFSTVIPAFLLAAAIHRIGASRTSIIGGLGPVTTIAMAMVFLNEPVSSMQIMGAALVVIGVFIIRKS